MLGLRLTLEQAQRLWGLDEQTCREFLAVLVEAKFLCRSRDGAYSRLTDGVTERPKMRMDRAVLADSNAQDVKEVV